MRLLNKDTFVFEWFNDENIPPFVILSHRWTGGETTLQQFMQRDENPVLWNAGIEKIIAFCEEVAPRSEQYVWVDTCCIDKTSSVELQEAINSMYRWYEEAQLCIVYLDDVDQDDVVPVKAQLERSRWFTRGWTLQELLAPRQEIFLDRQWKLLGSREDLADILESITNIDPACYGDATKIRSQAVAKRMSWLSQRTTSRVEDMAYCVLGIFDVNMPMLYGEGKKAFQRLQRQIIQDIDDESIFLWAAKDGKSAETVPILAPSPSCFSTCRDHTVEKDIFFDREPYRMTTKGLEIQLYGERTLQFEVEIVVYLNCSYDGHRALFRIRQRGKHWRRLAASSIETEKLDSHPVPMSAWEEFEKKMLDLQFQSSGRGGGHSRNGMSAATDFEREKIRFKVYIE